MTDFIPEDTASLKIADFDYPLPDERIAKHPLARRDACKLLTVAPDGNISHRHFTDLPSLLPSQSLLVCNNTRVINARMIFRKSTGATIEIFLLEPDTPADYERMFASTEPVVWKCLVGNSKRWKSGVLEMQIGSEEKPLMLRAERLEEGRVRLSWSDPAVSLATVVDIAGKIPIPPYLNRDSEASDSDDYQTVYSRVKGSVAAPTAGLHFTPELIDTLHNRGVTTAEVSLHVGAGTFRPVKCDRIGDHDMHTEHFSISLQLVRSLREAMRAGRPVIAVGTTSVRTLESIPFIGMKIARGETPHLAQWEAYSSPDINITDALDNIERYLVASGTDRLDCSTAIMIAPGFRWKIVTGLITNFHQPQSTLLLLVSSFLDRDNRKEPTWRRVYREALASGYRFLSYGDACLFFPQGVNSESTR